MRRAAGGFAVVALVLGTAWVGRVPLANAVLDRLPGNWHARLDGLDWQPGELVVRGLEIRHRPTGRRLAMVPRATATGRLDDWRRGHFASLALEAPEVTWHEPFIPPGEATSATPTEAPLVSWEKASIHDGRLTWIAADGAPPRLQTTLSLESGRVSLGSARGIEAATQRVLLTNLESRETFLDGRLAIAAAIPEFTVALAREPGDGTWLVDEAGIACPDIRVEWRDPSDAAPDTPPAAGSAASPPALRLASLSITKATIAAERVDGSDRRPLASAALDSLAAAGLRLGGSAAPSLASVDATLTNVNWPEAGVTVATATAAGSLPEKGHPLIRRATISGATLTDVAALLRLAGLPTDGVPDCRGRLDATLDSLALTPDGVRSTAVQRLTLTDGRAAWPGRESPLALLPSLVVAAVPDECRASRRLREITLTRPSFHVVPGPTGAAPSSPAAASVAHPADAPPPWHGWQADVFTVTEGTATVSGFAPAVPDITTRLAVATVPQDEAPLHRITLTDLSVRNPLLPASPIYTGSRLLAEIRPDHLWRDHAIDRIELDGQRLEVGDALLRLLDAAPATGDAEAAPSPDVPQPPDRPWHIRSALLDRTEVVIDDIGDGRQLRIPLPRQEFADIPLARDALPAAAAARVHKVEVPFIAVHAPWSEGHTVVELPVNFIHFSFAGLLDRRLERVELVTPKIKVGQPLFDYIDAARRRFARPGLAAVPAAPLLLAAGDDASLALGQAVSGMNPAAAPATQAPAWQIPLYTESGMVITAPRGREWPQFPRLPFRNARGPDGQPLPFLLRGETVHGELAVIPGWYDFPEWRLRVRIGSEGRVVFNFPMKERDNNLVEVFRGNTVLFRGLRVDDVWLSVTYDATGIYATLGGRTCGGYVNAGVNLYVDQLSTWDAWASFSGIRMAEITRLLTPEYLFLDGTVDTLTVKAFGDFASLYQLTADLRMDRPGTLELRCVDALRERLAGLPGWQEDLGGIGLDALRRCRFDSCTGEARLFGWEGSLGLSLKGAEGDRRFRVRMHDYRPLHIRSVLPF